MTFYFSAQHEINELFVQQMISIVEQSTHTYLVLKANNIGGLAIKKESNNLPEELLELVNKDYFDILGKVWGIPNPTEVLRECIEKEEWFKGVVLSTTFFEGVGAKVLFLRFGTQMEAENIEGLTEKKIGNLSLDTIMILLYALKIVDHLTYLRMVGVKDYRNIVVHQLSPFAKPEGKRSRRMIETAIKCLHKLMIELHEQRREFFLSPKRKQ